MKFQDLEQKYNSLLLERIQERFNKWKFEFQQKVNKALQISIKKYIALLENAKKETEKTKADSEQLKRDLNEKYSRQSQQLEEKLSEMKKQQREYTKTISDHTRKIEELNKKLSSEKGKDANIDEQKKISKQIQELHRKRFEEEEKYRAVEQELKKWQTIAEENKKKLDEALNEIKQIQQQSEMEKKRLADEETELNRVEQNQSWYDWFFRPSNSSTNKKETGANKVESKISANKNINANNRKTMESIKKEAKKSKGSNCTVM